MKKVYVFLLVLTLFSARSATAQLQNALFYHPQTKLQWEALQADVVEVEASAKPELFSVSFMKPVRIKPPHKVEVATGLVLEHIETHPLSGVARFRARAVVFKQWSWKDPEFQDSHTLAHAQLHFDIAELFARRLEKEINERKIHANNLLKMDQIHRKYKALLQEAHSLYDAETAGGDNREKMLEWERAIASQLAAYPRVTP